MWLRCIGFFTVAAAAAATASAAAAATATRIAITLLQLVQSQLNSLLISANQFG